MKSIFSKSYKLLQKIGVVRYSGKKNIYGLHPLIISTLVIIIALLLAKILRKIIDFVVKDGIVKEILLEFIATAELCACCFELIVVADTYGVLAYAIYLFLLTIWWTGNWESATACPYSTLEEYIEGSKDIYKAILIVISQVVGGLGVREVGENASNFSPTSRTRGLVIFHYVQLIWSIELAETHIGRAHEDCVADLAVPMAIGAVVEGFATFLCRIASRALSDIDVRFGNIVDAFFATSLVVAAFNFSGGYFNPALATSLKFGCTGNTHLEHLVVYWIGATAGSVASVYFYRLPFVQNAISKLKPKQE